MINKKVYCIVDKVDKIVGQVYFQSIWNIINVPRKGRSEVVMSLGENMGEGISRTAGNVYEKADKDTWMIFPKEKKYTSFLDVMDLTILSEEEDSNFEGLDIHQVIEEIENKAF